MSEEPKHVTTHDKRDSETFFILGIFIIALAIPVFVGTFYSIRFHAQVVNVAAAVALFLVGVGFLIRGWVYAKRVKAERERVAGELGERL